jgi:hypothetical protein
VLHTNKRRVAHIQKSDDHRHLATILLAPPADPQHIRSLAFSREISRYQRFA